MAKSHAKKSAANAASGPADFIVITALEEERDALLSKLRGVRKLDKEATDVHTYYRASVRTRRRDRSEYQVIVTSLLNMGPINASAQAVSVVNRWKPRFVLLVGIACGVRGEVSHGDVLIASQVADYTLGKQLGGRRTVRWEVFPCGASLLDSANNIAADWEGKIGVARPRAGSVQRHKGVVASGGDVISDDQVIATYSESWPKLIGIEMEAGGVAAGVHQTIDRPEFLMIKGVSDFGKDKHDPEVKPWRRYASHAAAAFAVRLIKSGPARSLAEVTEDDQTARAEDDERRSAERRWQYIQSHPIRGVEIMFLLKGAVGLDWFRKVLDDTRLTFSREEQSFRLSQILAASATPNTKERSRTSDSPVCSFWEIYKPESGYWVRKITAVAREFSVVAGFDAEAPWSMLGMKRVVNLEDLALLTEIGVSIPARAYEVGIEEFVLTFRGDTFSFSVKLSEHCLDALHEFARMQHAVGDKTEPMPLGTSFGGVQLLDMFLRQLLPRSKKERSRDGVGMMGLSHPGPEGKAIMFYPTMPPAFNKSAESNEYTFTLTTPARFDSASDIKRLEKEIALSPREAKLYFELALAYSYEGRVHDLLRCLDTAIETADPSPDVHGLMAQNLRRLGRLDEALVHAQKALALAPDDARIQEEAGICLGELGMHDTALVHLEAAARIEPSDPAYQSNLCFALMCLQRYSEAILPAQRAAELAPDDSQSALRLGMLLDNQGQRAKAEVYLERATQLAPDSGLAHQELGRNLAVTNQHEKAVESFQRALDIKEDVRLCELLGASLAALDRWPEAETAFRRGVKLEPNHLGMMANLAVAIARLGRFPEVVELCEELLRHDPNHTRAQRMLQQVKKRLGKA